jgi:Tol biopolymer transport system component
MRKSGLVGLVSGLGLLLGAVESVSAQQVVYASKRPEGDTMNVDIYSSTIRSIREKRLTDNFYRDTKPNLSPDEKKIAYVSIRNGRENIFVMNSDGTEQKMLVKGSLSMHNEYRQLRWSPDSKKLVYVSKEHATMRHQWNTEAYVINTETMERNRLTHNKTRDGWPNWDPNGSWIYFEAERDWKINIYRIKPDGTGEERLTNVEGFVGKRPVVSPDGNTIIYETNRTSMSRGKSPTNLWMMDADGSNQRPLVEGAHSDVDAVFNSTGSAIAFSSDRFTERGKLDKNYEIMKINLDGSGLTRLTEREGSDTSPRWTGSAIFFLSDMKDINGKKQVMYMDETGGSLREVSLPGVASNQLSYYGIK